MLCNAKCFCMIKVSNIVISEPCSLHTYTDFIEFTVHDNTTCKSPEEVTRTYCEGHCPSKYFSSMTISFNGKEFEADNKECKCCTGVGKQQVQSVSIIFFCLYCYTIFSV